MFSGFSREAPLLENVPNVVLSISRYTKLSNCHIEEEDMARYSMFKNTAVAKPATKKPVTNPHAEGDCFNALAEGILNYCFSDPGKTAHGLLMKLVVPFYICYPDSKPTFIHASSINVEERFQFLKNTFKRNLKKGLAFVLRQLAVKELAENPQAYAGMYSGNISLQAMREPDMPLDEKSAFTALTALARSLHLNLNIAVTEPRKDGRSVINYQPDEPIKISINQENNVWVASVSPEFLAGELADGGARLPTAQYLMTDIPDHTQLMQRIQASEKHLLNWNEQAEKMLQGLDISDLTTIYRESLSAYATDALVHDITFGIGTQDFFTAAKSRSFSGMNQEDYIRRELIQGIAQKYGLGHFEHLEQLLDTLSVAKEDTRVNSLS